MVVGEGLDCDSKMLANFFTSRKFAYMDATTGCSESPECNCWHWKLVAEKNLAAATTGSGYSR